MAAVTHVCRVHSQRSPLINSLSKSTIGQMAVDAASGRSGRLSQRLFLHMTGSAQSMKLLLQQVRHFGVGCVTGDAGQARSSVNEFMVASGASNLKMIVMCKGHPQKWLGIRERCFSFR